MACLQGSTLVSYDDAKFSDNDIAALRRIGGATKRTDASKRGNYGQGFNAVYHVTDMPLIRTGGWILMVDPNLNFLNGA